MVYIFGMLEFKLVIYKYFIYFYITNKINKNIL